MNLHFEPVTPENRKQMELLRPFPDQVNFIESVTKCLEEADTLPQWRPVGIYDASTLVGFAMYGRFEEPLPEVWLDRLLIDQKYQGHGYGEAAVEALLKKLSEEYNCNKIYLSVYDVNQSAIHLYQKIGFYFNGKFDINGERLMVYDVKRAQ